MKNEEIEKACAEPTQRFSIQIPCILAERVAAYASANNTTITNVVIEALDFFIRKRTS